MVTGRMTEQQQKLVEENVGLVRLHIRRHVSGLGKPTREREWDDLFQEGCLGLAQAACTFEQSKGIPFAPYALRRIHAAVSRAVHQAFATVRVPKAEWATPAGEKRQGCRVVSLDFDPVTRATDDRHDHIFRESNETIANRMVSKYHRAVHRAAEAAATGDKAQRGLTGVIERLVDERLLVPDEAYKSSLRNIARDSKASFARVTHMEKRLLGHIRSTLTQDPELAQLRTEARRSRDGVETDVGRSLKRRIAQAVGNRFGLLFQSSMPACQGAMLVGLLQRRGLDIGCLARSLFGRLGEEDQVALLSQWTESAGKMPHAPH